MRVRGILYGVGIIAAIVFGWRALRHINIKADAKVTSQVLPKEDKAEYIIDSSHHTITTVSRVGNKATGRSVVHTQFVAGTAKIELKQDGSIVVTSRSFGTELAPWVGLSIDSEAHGRGAVGVNLLYVKRYELGGGLSLNVTNPKDVRAFVGVSYNVYSNILITSALDNHGAVSVGLAIKF